jgi:transcriptional regulator with XRE-family HTH domain
MGGRQVIKEPETAARVRTLRKLLGFESATDFADFLGISVTRLHNIEKDSPLSREVAFLIVDKVPGITLDWLYFGRLNGLSFDLAQRLRGAANGR